MSSPLRNKDITEFLKEFGEMSVSFPANCFLFHKFIRLSSRNIQVFGKHVQNLYTLQNSVSWDLEMGFNSVRYALRQYPGHHFKYVNLPYPLQHFIAIKWNWWLSLTTYLGTHILKITDFSITYPHSLALRGTLALYECVCVISLTLHLLYPQRKSPEYHLNRMVVWQGTWPASPEEVKNRLILPGT
jgi:hypothetical protein